MERFRIAVGYEHGVKPGNIVGAIANEADLDSEYIGHIEIHEDFTTVDLPAGMPRETFAALRKARVCQQRLDISPLAGGEGRGARSKAAADKDGNQPVKRRPKLQLKAKAKTGIKPKPKDKKKNKDKAKRAKKKTARKAAPR